MAGTVASAASLGAVKKQIPPEDFIPKFTPPQQQSADQIWNHLTSQMGLI